MKINIDLLETGGLEQRIAERVVAAIRNHLPDAGPDGDHLFTRETLASYLGVSKEWVQDRRRYHQIPFIKVGKFVKYRKRDIDRWLDGKTIPEVNPYSGKMPKKPGCSVG